MFAYNDGLFDKMVQILRNGRTQSVGLQNTSELATSHVLDLADAVRVTENDTNLRRSETLLGELADLFANLSAFFFEPARGTTAIRDGGSRNTFSKKL